MNRHAKHKPGTLMLTALTLAALGALLFTGGC